MGKTSGYFGVSRVNRKFGMKCETGDNLKKPWTASFNHMGKVVIKKNFATEREAAIAYDKAVLRAGIDRPLNILKPKL